MMLYRYEVDRDTLETIKYWSTDNWIEVINSLCTYQAIPYNVSFGESLGPKRLLEIYALTIKYNISPDRLFSAAYKLFHQSLRRLDVTTCYGIIELFDLAKPALYFNSLVGLLFNREYDNLINQSLPNDFPIRYHLINALIPIDSENRILDHLLMLSNSLQPPVYYQLLIRCIYINSGTSELNNAMRNVLSLPLPAMCIEYLLLAFREYVFINQDFQMLYEWLSSELLTHYQNRRSLPDATYEFCKKIISWINKDAARLTHFNLYPAVYLLLSVYNSENNYSAPLAYIKEIVKKEPHRLKDKNKLCDFIANQNVKLYATLKIERDSINTARLWLENDDIEFLFDMEIQHVRLAIENLELGLENYRWQNKRKKDSVSVLIFSDEQIALSLSGIS